MKGLKFLVLIASLTLALIGCGGGGGNDDGGGDPTKVAMPTASPGAGTVASGTAIALTSTTSGATISYTLDGSTPGESLNTVIYNNNAKPSITGAAGATVTLKAIAIKSGMTVSDTLTAVYTIAASGDPVLNFTITNTDEWNAAIATIKSQGNNLTYTLDIGGNAAIGVPPAPFLQSPTFGDKTGITVNMQGHGTLFPNANGALIILQGSSASATQTLNISGITLQGRSNNTQSVVRVHQYAVLNMSSGEITENTENAAGPAFNGGGVYVAENGVFNMTGGEVSYNYAGGGGVYVNRGTFTMSGDAKVSGNESVNDGGGVYMEGGTFTMSESAEISGNTAYSNGGGVFTSGGPTLTNFAMQGGTISGNTANRGGGWYHDSGTFTKTGGVIAGVAAGDPANNTATRLSGDKGNAVYAPDPAGSGNPTVEDEDVTENLTIVIGNAG